MSANILLIYVFQVNHGSIFLYFGLISALFMLGLFVGGQMSATFFSGKHGYLFPLFSLLLLVLFGILRLSALRLVDIFPLGLAFWATGVVCGLWLPRAAAVLQFRGWHERNIAWQLWLFDSLGGAVGGLLCAVLLLPLFGALRTLDIFLLTGGALLILSFFLGGGFRKPKALLVPLMICFWAASAVADDIPAAKAADALLPKGASSRPQMVTFNGKTFAYYIVKGPGKHSGYIFDSAKLISGIKGYGGELRLLIYTDEKGDLLNFTTLKHKETPELLAKVKARKQELLKKNVFEGKSSFKTDAVTGATYSSRALVKTLNAAGKAFRALLAGKKSATTATEKPERPPPGGPRNIDAKKYRELISQKKLSEQKAMYFKKL
jgi:Na+-translocating ferredoxin:NAD+ oxidoreductase RnfG subunit